MLGRNPEEYTPLCKVCNVCNPPNSQTHSHTHTHIQTRTDKKSWIFQTEQPVWPENVKSKTRVETVWSSRCCCQLNCPSNLVTAEQALKLSPLSLLNYCSCCTFKYKMFISVTVRVYLQNKKMCNCVLLNWITYASYDYHGLIIQDYGHNPLQNVSVMR